jgi:malate dehydrogenase
LNKISLIGAGNIGTILAYSLSRKKIGQITLVDVIDGLAEGKCLDLAQSFPIDNLNLSIEGTNDISKIEDSHAIIITAGIARKPGMSRDDLIETNFSIMSKIGKAIKKYSPKAFIICVTNPLDAMVWSLKNITGIQRNMITGMAGILDSSRFRFFLSKAINVSVENIQTIVMGGHGDTMVPLLDYTSIGGIPIQNFIDQGIVKKKTIELIIERTRNGGGEVVSLMKNSSAFFSPACSAIEMLESYLFDQKKLLPCSTYLDGEYGVKNVFVGVPVIIGKGGIEKIIELKLSKESKTEFSKSVNSVKDLIKKCKKLLE